MTKGTSSARKCRIIPYQELLGNYDSCRKVRKGTCIIPYQELLGNYDLPCKLSSFILNYTIPRAIRELWLSMRTCLKQVYYTIPRAIRELWRGRHVYSQRCGIIPYQELLGNYDSSPWGNPYKSDYTIPRAIRELWRSSQSQRRCWRLYYTKSY